MVFSSPIFLFLFLPVVLTVYPLLPGIRLKNLWLLTASFVFYAWGEPYFVFLMVLSSLANWAFGLWVDHEQDPKRKKGIVALTITANLLVIAIFKYDNFVVDNLNALLTALGMSPIRVKDLPLPIGISFFTFQALSYVVDVYRKDTKVEKNPFNVALYIFFFPQLIAGPIVRYIDIAREMVNRVMTRDTFAEGIRRFVGGLAKKMIIANVVAVPADQIFALPASELTPSVAWLGVVCYSLQIYFDFSGYSDMAIGLGRMFGFHFLENFNYPYISQSIKEFWRRWHISLSTWFRDYLYIPLGGNRRGEARNYFNLVTVFFLCGLWHGASWAFVIWGLYHGFFLVLERTKFGKLIDAMPRPLRHLYTIFVFMMGWVLFRADTFGQAVSVYQALFGLTAASTAAQPLARYVSNQVIAMIIVGAIFSTPIWPWLKSLGGKLLTSLPGPVRPITHGLGLVAETLVIAALLLVSSAWLAGGTYNPFIYFRF